MTTETTQVDIETVADLIAALEKVKDKSAKLSVCGTGHGGCFSCSAEDIDRQITSIEVSSWDQFAGMVELKI